MSYPIRSESLETTRLLDPFCSLVDRANQDDANAQFEIGMRYAEGREVKQNAITALRYLERAADQGHREAQKAVRTAYSTGWNGQVPINPALEFRYLKLAADSGDIEAQIFAGAMYEQGDRGVNRDLGQAFHYFQQAADSLSPDPTMNQYIGEAQCKVGQFYLKGWGVDPNETIGLQYLVKAKENGNEYAKELLDRYASCPCC